ncbi:mannose-1-phosphate guanylyltransferase/mannose-6-phosphate isomerase [Chlorobaculum parvum NCIB 8327]|uniref:mannose-1-phosphate guanylyltransferase n=1 Tax=Chlorobaculum parvum (strain DSM 263 / NCIMB 8327) TaxID=517417 RepID=B3QQB7_CHLP8|nr:mannose-1-phosphate guanylyltransferase/mannose-6-phosphate isomerase [Chlorobaculum parvum]ACF12120.1 mannose-1-phosphate guanylyltransferase/mannose-6-phosphate isomerase [Chlorobaculum parvum NCIB 8327]
MIMPVILSGGSGTRLWPLSRALYPKQLLPLFGDKTMLQDTVLRVETIDGVGPVTCVCNDEHRFLVAEQLRQIGADEEAIILEPVGRNTAPAAAVAALMLADKHPGSLMLVMPADHVILDRQAFAEAIESGRQAAEDGNLVTFGIVPNEPETGYGYIRSVAGSEKAARPVAEFVEKPSRERAESYLASGDYFWNSGMFLFRPEVYLAELEVNAPEMLAACRAAVEKARIDLDFLRLDLEAFKACPSDSIDYAVMEKTTKAMVVPMDAGWNDVGAWSSLWEVQERDPQGNVMRGDVLAHDVQNSYLHSTSRLVAAVGLENHIVVETCDAVLVASKDRVQEVKAIVEQLHLEAREEPLIHRRVYRPWGSYETVDEGERFKVKRITVKPGASLSLQLHHKRAEHWIVVKGTAVVTVDDRQVELVENESIYIPVEARHRLENRGKEPLELIEVQSGRYLGEDDIERFEDNYGRL